ncbi:uncharacterized protein EKO05_0010861 [Ascochyta rabiei]|uniref:uncharacterized protein n=1 Tax=Didymella rabiei TaxID=5454 RepID=UPI0021FCBF3A|nr:uncharacterized protein EKO05_0010861 [Ascochyta rabiei]UPX20633.1 hypothetical protein EKO05_0010861 [Ascochyta rabiei]
MFACGYSFFISGVNDGTLGPLIPYILNSFKISTGQVAYIYACTFVGWITALPINPVLVNYLPLGLILALGAALQLLGQFMRPWGPLPLYSVSFFFCGLGMAVQDSHANTFVSSAKVAHIWLGFIHASYAAGLAVGPIISTALASKEENIGGVASWKATYYALIGLNALNVAGTFFAFQDSLRHKQAGQDVVEIPERKAVAMHELKRSIKCWSLWAISMAFFLQLGAMMTASGWVVEFLTKVRGGDLKKMGYVPTGCNAGILLGRIVLAEPIHRLGEQSTILASFVLTLAFQLVFWLVPDIIGSAVALALMGFFSGPFFPVGIAVSSKLFPREIRSTALGFIFVLAQAGAALFPSMTGLVAQKAGVQVLQPIVTALLVLGGLFWWRVPNVREIEL